LLRFVSYPSTVSYLKIFGFVDSSLLKSNDVNSTQTPLVYNL